MKRLNTTDRFLVVLLALCLLAVGARVWSLRGDSSENVETLEVLVVWREIDARTAECLSVGERLYTAAGEYYGTVADIEYLPVEKSLWQNGELWHYEMPIEEICDVRLTLRLEGRSDNGIFLRNGTESVGVGESKTLYSERCEISCVVLFCGVKS